MNESTYRSHRDVGVGKLPKFTIKNMFAFFLTRYLGLMKVDQAVIELQVSVKPSLAMVLLRSLSEFQFAAGSLLCSVF